MKYPLVAVCLSLLVVLGAGCQKEQTSVSPLPPTVQELQTQSAPETTKEETRTPPTTPTSTNATSKLYRGTWFDVSYPATFTAAPQTPTSTYNRQTTVQTDEATFTSPDGKVEFFVFSPLWSGEPKDYLTVGPREGLVDEKIVENPDNGPSGGTKTRWTTIKAEDDSYYRSFVSIQRQVGTGSEVHHVFGIKYRDTAAYEAYKAEYTAFKQSLRQYAD
jgi:hypothetical protein